jgi:hypothetical protein
MDRDRTSGLDFRLGHGMPHQCTTAAAVGRWDRYAKAMFAAMAALMMLAADTAARELRHAQTREEVAPRQGGEPIMAIVSIKSQQFTFYDADGWILRAPVSTGATELETPAGVFAIVQKKKDHHSNMYDDAWMPHMQRITWNGIALHGGPLPGYAASHGCVRLPFSFAERLFDKTRIGMRVIIAPDDTTPVAFSHPALLVPNAEALAAASVRAGPLAREAAEAARAPAATSLPASTAKHDVARRIIRRIVHASGGKLMTVRIDANSCSKSATANRQTCDRNNDRPGF